MQSIKSWSLLLLVTGLTLACQQSPQEDQTTEAEESNNAINLFEEGGDWQLGGNAKWEFKDGEIVGKLDTGFGFLMTRKAYANFELSLEFYPDSTINSGVFTRCQEVELSPFTCYEFNIWDLHPNQDFRTGALVAKAKPLVKVDCLDKWNSYKISCKDAQLQAWINDQKVIDVQDTTLQAGFVAIQAAGNGQVKFRNIVLEE